MYPEAELATSAYVPAAAGRDARARPFSRGRLKLEPCAGVAVVPAWIAAVALAGHHGSGPPAAWAALVVLNVLVWFVGFRIGDGHTVPLHLVFVPALALLPTGLVAIAVLVGQTSTVVGVLRGAAPADRLVLGFTDTWGLLAAVAVLAALGHPAPSLHALPVYLAAIAAQSLVDDFKAVNDSLGHQSGDRVLAEVRLRCARVAAATRSQRATAARSSQSSPRAPTRRPHAPSGSGCAPRWRRASRSGCA